MWSLAAILILGQTPDPAAAAPDASPIAEDGAALQPTPTLSAPLAAEPPLVIDAQAVPPPAAAPLAPPPDAAADDDSDARASEAVTLTTAESLATSTAYRLSVASRLQLDLGFENTDEDVAEWWNAASLRLSHRQGDSLSLVAEAQTRWGVTGKDPRPAHRFWLANSAEPQWAADTRLREAHVTVRRGIFEARLGAQLFVWGKNEVFAAADVLNPVDLRYDVVAALETPKEARLPIVALDLGAFAADWSAELVLAPYFEPHHATVIGRDFSVARPGSELERRILAVGQVSPSIEDQLQQAAQGTEQPQARPQDFTWAVRGTARLKGVDVAATAVYGWDRLPRVWVDPDLSRLLAAADLILADPQTLTTDPALRTASLNVQQKALAGQALLASRFHRLTRFAAEAQTTIGSVVARADVGFSPDQTFYTTELLPIGRPAATAALGLEYTYGDAWYVATTGYALAVLRPPAWGRLLHVERDRQPIGDRPLAALYGISSHLRWRDDDLGLQAAVTGAFDVAPGDHVLWGELQYDHLAPHVLKLGALVMNGPAGTLGRSYAENDLAYLAYGAAW